MSDAQEKTAAAAPGAPPAAAAAKGPALPVLAAAVALALGAGGALGALALAPLVTGPRAAAPAHAEEDDAEGEHAAPKKGKHGEEARLPVHRLDNLIVNPAGSQGQRFLMTTVAIEVASEKDLERLRLRDLQLRDEVVAVLGRETLESLTAPGGRDSLRDRLAAAVRPFVSKRARPRVYLPQFVVQ